MPLFIGTFKWYHCPKSSSKIFINSQEIKLPSMAHVHHMVSLLKSLRQWPVPVGELILQLKTNKNDQWCINIKKQQHILRAFFSYTHHTVYHDVLGILPSLEERKQRAPEGYSTKFYTGRLCPEVQNLTLLYTIIFDSISRSPKLHSCHHNFMETRKTFFIWYIFHRKGNPFIHVYLP